MWVFAYLRYVQWKYGEGFKIRIEINRYSERKRITL